MCLIIIKLYGVDMQKLKAVLVILLSLLGLQSIAAKLDSDYSAKVNEISSHGKGVDNHGERACGTRKSK